MSLQALHNLSSVVRHLMFPCGRGNIGLRLSLVPQLPYVLQLWVVCPPPIASSTIATLVMKVGAATTMIRDVPEQEMVPALSQTFSTVSLTAATAQIMVDVGLLVREVTV